MQQERSQRWQRLISQITGDYQCLLKSEKDWIGERLLRIEILQQQLNRFFEQGRGVQSCSACQGDCCAIGHNHMTLANMLGYLSKEDQPPNADFSKTCPFLGEQGCLLTVGKRPYNCISFICDILENSLTSAEIAEFYALEQQLRVIYLQFAERYVGGGMTGLLLQEARLAGRSFFDLKPSAAVLVR